VLTDMWAYGAALVPERYRGLRLGWCDVWYRDSEDSNPYAHHVTGLHPVVDLNRMTLLELEDSGETSPGPKVLRTGTAAASAPPAGPGGGPTPPESTSAAPTPPLSAVVAGTLTVSPASLGLRLSLSGLWSGTLTLTAQGGPVSGYHVTVPVPLLQDLTLSQASGSLAAGQSVHVQVTAAGAALFSTALLTVNPGGLSVPVTYHLLG